MTVKMRAPAGADLRVWPALATVVLVAAGAVAAYRLATMPAGHAGTDFDLYVGATRQWLASGDFYHARQLEGPYQIVPGDILYPPVVMVLFLPWMVLPPILWWIVPLAITTGIIVAWRPHAIAWLGVGLLLTLPWTRETIFWGNPNMWIMAAVAAALRFGWPGVLVLVKPTLAPFALIGIRTRGWWIAAAVVAGVSLPFGALWLQWIQVVRDASGGIAYSLQYYPMMLIPVVAYLGRQSIKSDHDRPTAAVGFEAG